MIRIAVVDDSNQDAERTATFLSRFFHGDTGRYHLSVYTDGIFFLNDYRPVFDIVFMDIDMPHSNGMEVAKKLRKLDSRVILMFMTNLAQYAAEGYDVDAIGFLVKPIDFYGFELKMRKAIEILNSRKEVHFLMNLSGEDGNSRKLVSSDSILYLEVMNHNVSVHTKEGEYLIWSSLRDCADRLQDAHFSYISRFVLVNLIYVEKIDSECVTVCGNKLSLSRSKRRDFLQDLTDYYGGN